MKNLLSLCAFISFFLLISCDDIEVNFDDNEPNAEKIQGNEKMETETRNHEDFENIEVRHHFNVELKQGDFGISIDAESNILDYLITEVENNTLVLRKKKGFRLKTKKTPKVYISMPTVKNIDISGAGSFRNKGTFDAENVRLRISGGADMDLDFDCESLRTELSGAADFDLEGSADRFEVSTSGAGSIDAQDFIAEDVLVSVSGAASVKVHASNHLKASISGIGSVRYGGEPKNIDKQVSGLGSIKPL